MEYTNNKDVDKFIDAYLQQLKMLVKKNCDGKVSVLLIGSLARGEGTWKYINSIPELVSDIEYLIIYEEGFITNNLRDEIDRLNQIYVNASHSSTFHIDYSFIKRSDLKNLERKLLVYDSKMSGALIIGREVVDDFPEININNINLIDIRDVIIHRVFAVSFYGDAIDNHESDEYSYLISKNMLDLMTVILASKGVLISGFGNRLNYIEDNNLCPELLEVFKQCLAVKLNCLTERTYSNEELRSIFIKTCDDLFFHFKLYPKNNILNFYSIIRRILGIVKRSIIYRHMVEFGYYNRLSYNFKSEDHITRRIMLDNLVVNGFPTLDAINARGY